MFSLINMNGRLYDPALGAFLSPDPYVQLPNFTQNYNRYAYCLNNPLMYTDPTGLMTWKGALVSLLGTAVGVTVAILTGGLVGGMVVWDDETGYWNVTITSAYTAGSASVRFGQSPDANGNLQWYGNISKTWESVDWQNIGWNTKKNDKPIDLSDNGFPKLDVPQGGAYGKADNAISYNPQPNNSFSIIPKIPYEDTWLIPAPWLLKTRSAYTVPHLGIYIDPYEIGNYDFTYHEYGHILQANSMGTDWYIAHVVPNSIKSYRRGPLERHRVMPWETMANAYAYEYFSKKGKVTWNTWNHKMNPFSPVYYMINNDTPRYDPNKYPIPEPWEW